jgi:hypothetical protein
VRPTTRYAKSGEYNIAYQVVGDGPVDLVFVPGFVSHVEHAWEDPGLARVLERLASFSRLILFDLVAGSGLTFAEHGTFELKGVPGSWRIFRVESPAS